MKCSRIIYNLQLVRYIFIFFKKYFFEGLFGRSKTELFSDISSEFVFQYNFMGINIYKYL